MKQARDSQKRIAFVQLFAEADASAVPEEIQVVPCGKWSHPVYGEMEITPADITEFVQNFSRGVRLDIPITQGHDNGMSGGELPAVCWFTDLMDRGQDGLWGATKWTEEGKQLLISGAFKYFSPEFYEQYSDPETGVKYGHVLVGGALTNKPYFKELQPVANVFSEPDITSEIIDTMNLKDIVAKQASDLSNEEKDFLRTHKEELSAEQQTAFASVFDEDGGQGGEEDGGGTGADKGNDDGDGEKKNASEHGGKKVVMSEAEATALRQAADKGVKALEKIEATERKAIVDKYTFSERNPSGRFLPKQAGAVEKFLKTLSEPQRDAFVQILENMPKADASMFSEKGDGGSNAEATKAGEVAALVKAKMEGKTMKYSEALSAVLKENPVLASEYNEEMQANRG